MYCDGGADGSSAQIRENAAEKLGEVAARSPAYCASILQQLRPLIVDMEWEVRVAASRCLDVVARSLRTEDENVADVFALVSLGDQEASDVALGLQTVDINKVVKEGAPLLRSGGEEYQYATNLTEEERRVYAAKQRRLLLKRLSGAGGPIWKTREDSLTKQLLPRLNRDHAQEIADDIVASDLHPSAEEELVPTTSQKQATELLSIPGRSKRRCVTQSGGDEKRVKFDHDIDVVMKSEGDHGSVGGESNSQSKAALVAGLVSDLLESMFDSKWEVRHGSLLSLRQVLMAAQFTTAVDADRPAMSKAVQRCFVDKWLEECLIRCICVLALDQFVDYSADGSVSPVREVCAQVFGIFLGSLSSEDMLVGYLQVVRTLFSGSTWHACHGGLLGLKYLVRAHSNHAQALVPLIFDDIVTAFSPPDSEEDVLVLAADMFQGFVSFLDLVEHKKITKTALLLWTSLCVHESAGLVTASIVQALSAWYSYSKVARLLQDNADVQIAIWQNLSLTIPMLHHHSHSVRASSATCVAAIFSSEFLPSKSSPSDFARVFLPHLLLQLLLEKDISVRRSLLSAWQKVISSLSKEDLLQRVIADQLPKWMELLWSTHGIGCLNAKMVKSDGTVSDWTLVSSPDNLIQDNLSSRIAFAEAFGFVACHVPLSSSCMAALIQLVHDGVRSSSGERQCGVLLALLKWSYYEKQLNSEERFQRIQHLQTAVGSLLNSFAKSQWRPAQPATARGETPVFYNEQLGFLKRVMQMETRIIDVFSSVGILLQPANKPGSGSTADISRQIAEHIALFPYDRLQTRPKEFELTHFKRQDLFLVDELVQQSFSRFSHRIQGLGSGAYCELLPIPKKCGFLVKALMNSVKEEEEEAYRNVAAQAIAGFVVAQASVQKKCVAKVISNLCNSAGALIGECGSQNNDPLSIPAAVRKKTQVRVAGAEAALREICKRGGCSLFETCRALEEVISKAWSHPDADDLTIQRCMHLITLVIPHVDSGVMVTSLSWLDRLAILTRQPYEYSETRRAVAHAIATICKKAEGQHRESAMLVIYKAIFVAFSKEGRADTEALEGAVMVLDRIVHTLGSHLMPYIPSLVHYAMKTMSSQSKHIRTLAAGVFADLVPLIPLQMDLKLRDPEHILPDSLREIVVQNAASRSFLGSFTEGKAIQPTDMKPYLSPGTTLRVYQQHGVDWLCFMAKNNLHGILADDMGLGKTLQTLSAVAATLGSDAARPCLIVCPPIIVHHWMQEVKKYIPGVFEFIIDYSLPASERKGTDILASACGSTLIVTTYSILRSDIELLSKIDYSFAVLDEAHLIRNPSTALFRAVLELRASHRVALSGTPLQNNVTDLWALFEFLMPGYLGDFTLFRGEFVLPITKSKERNTTPKQKELAAIAIAKLHQKVLPFILRRTKDQVLEELPPKIISNVLLPLSPLQKRLYSLASSNEDKTVDTRSKLRGENTDAKPLTNVLTNLQLLRKICVHPALVADNIVTSSLNTKEKGSLHDWKSSGKMIGLRDLLVECCDIAAWDQGTRKNADIADDSSISPHRCLVFAHLQKTLDLAEEMLRDALPAVTYRRLDGQTPHAKRADVVQHFNADPSIDVLLLTTSVGGLGLTLTGADTVIFIEHSWNPFVDLQAMDRAHRIGQKRTVRVFRMIMEDSLEEHIMNLQEFKEKVAATVVQKSDAQTSMNTHTKGVLNLLQASSSAVAAKEIRAAAETKENEQHVATVLPQAAQELLDQIGELWDESQYESLAFPELTDE